MNYILWVFIINFQRREILLMSIKAIGFDLDDTLYDRGDYYRHIFNIMEKSIIKTDLSFDGFYEVFQRYSDIEYEKFIQRGKSKDEYKLDRVIDTYTALGKSISREDAIIFDALYLYYRNKVTFREGVEELLNYLLESELDLFILTNGPSGDQRKKLKQLNVENYIPKNRWFISDELKCSKPDLEVFKKVEHIIGYKNEEIMYIGDNYVNDIIGAYNANWKAMLLNVHGNVENMNNTLSVDRINKIIPILKNIL